MNFFNLKQINKPVVIKFWDDIEVYRIHFNELMKPYNMTVSPWEIGRSTNNKKTNRIDLLCLEERRKSYSHQNDDIDSMIKVVIHEFVHTCHYFYNNNMDEIIWLTEAFATNLSNQYTKEEVTFDCSLEDILNSKVFYYNYYAMGKYLIDNCDREYILRLAKDNEFLKKETPSIYYQTKKYFGSKIK